MCNPIKRKAMTHRADVPPIAVAPNTTIPLIDLRGKTQVDLLRDHKEIAHALVYNATDTLGIVSRLAAKMILPWADRVSREWLERTKNPYLAEIDAMAKIVGIPGTYALNMSYEWGCTSGAFATGDGVTLLRLLDWPFPEMGKHVLVVRTDSQAGEFYNVGWPGLSGMLTGMAPGRFSAALNQAPMRKHGLTLPGDWLKNRFIMRRNDGIPPPHLLRQVFEGARDYAAAREILIKTPVALPVIYILAGVRPGEGCVIERTETAAEVMDLTTASRVSAANHFNSNFNTLGRGWRPRTEDSPDRYASSRKVLCNSLTHNDFDWVQPPMLNQFTRLGVMADAAQSRLIVQGLEGATRQTKVFSLQEQNV
jgi:hypothetical protein